MQLSNYADVEQAHKELGVARTKWGALADWEAARAGWMDASCVELDPEAIQAKVGRGFESCLGRLFTLYFWITHLAKAALLSQRICMPVRTRPSLLTQGHQGHISDSQPCNLHVLEPTHSLTHAG